MQFYTVSFLICQETQEVLLIKKNHTGFAGRLNGVGGKLLDGEMSCDGAVRSIEAETGVDVDDRISFLGTSILPVDCASDDKEGCTLDFFTALVDKNEIFPPRDQTEELCWVPIADVLSAPVTSEIYAGKGDVQYFVSLAVNGYK